MLGLSGNISPTVTPPMQYADLSSLANYEDLDIHFDFSTVTATLPSGSTVDRANNLGAAGSDYDITSVEGTPRHYSAESENNINGRNVVKFGGSDDILDMAANYTTTGKAMTLFLVFQKDDTSNDHVLASSDDSDTDFLRTAASGGSLVLKAQGQTAVTTVINDTANSTTSYTIVEDKPILLVVTRNAAGEISFFADTNIFIGTKTNTAAKAAANFTLGAIGGTTSGSKADLGGYVCEVGLYDVLLTNTNRDILMTSLCDKWGIE
tara:strand:- start:423 stop:1217 length:795 start_codon:yes stop_codon:yes gene_type:complete